MLVGSCRRQDAPSNLDAGRLARLPVGWLVMQSAVAVIVSPGHGMIARRGQPPLSGGASMDFAYYQLDCFMKTGAMQSVQGMTELA